jgi:capsular exopolysaccharide synthesis family protein
MSKIYEALRQAEQDRANNRTAQNEPVTRGTSVGQALLDSPRVRVTIADASDRGTAVMQEPAALEASGVEGLMEAPVADPVADLGLVQEVTWTPSLQQLPALEERGAAVEQFRSLRSRMHEFRDLNKLKSILVSSGLPQEGKTFVAANLAISFARHKAARVLLIDGDMRRASLHKMLGTKIGPGLTEYLAGQATLEEIMQRPKASQPGHPLPHGLLSLTFIPGGNEHEKAADLSGNHRFDRLIADASPHFDWIVVDSSPVNLVSDGVNLARACDGVLMVAREGITKYEAAQRALAELKAAKILGFVLNAVHNPTIAGGYYGYDGYDKVTE